MTIFIPDTFAQTMRKLYGEMGAAWLESLPDLIATCEKRWALTVQPPFPGLSYNFAAPVVMTNGETAVLKIGVVNPELLAEIEALRLYNGHGIVRLLAADPARGVLLLERLQPGKPLIALAEDDEQATGIAAQVMQQLWRPAPKSACVECNQSGRFPTVSDWAQGLNKLGQAFDDGFGPFPRRLVETAVSLFADLLPTQAAPVLLHGDLHHWNILSAARQPWLALDPKGVIGEPAYEVGAWLRNPIDRIVYWPDLARIQARRIDQFAEILGLDHQRLIGWGIAQAVLSAWWSFEDLGHVGETALACAEALLPLNS